MKICDYCILFSSSATEETVMMEIPTIDFKVDNEIHKRLQYFYDDRVVRQIKKWKDISFDGFKKIIEKLDKKNGEIIKKFKSTYLTSHSTSKKILDHFLGLPLVDEPTDFNGPFK